MAAKGRPNGASFIFAALFTTLAMGLTGPSFAQGDDTPVEEERPLVEEPPPVPEVAPDPSPPPEPPTPAPAPEKEKTIDDPPVPSQSTDAGPAEENNNFGTVAGFTFAGGVVGALVGGGCTALLPCLCGPFVGCPLATTSVGAGALLGAAIASDWELKKIWGPTMAGLALGGAGSIVGTVAAIFAAAVVGGTLPSAGVDPGAANTNNALAAGAAALTAGCGILVGSVAAAFAAAYVYELTGDDKEKMSAGNAASAQMIPAAPKSLHDEVQPSSAMLF